MLVILLKLSSLMFCASSLWCHGSAVCDCGISWSHSLTFSSLIGSVVSEKMFYTHHFFSRFVIKYVIKNVSL